MASKKQDLYSTLGIDKTASKEEVKKAYKNKANKVHPDKEGGSQEEFYQVSIAYKVLSDDKRRAKYDNTGSYEEQVVDNTNNTAIQLAFNAVQLALKKAIDNNTPYTVDIISTAKKSIKTEIHNIMSAKNSAENNKQIIEIIIKRLLCKNGNNFIHIGFNKQLEAIDESLELINKDIELREKALDLLNSYGYAYSHISFLAEVFEI